MEAWRGATPPNAPVTLPVTACQHVVHQLVHLHRSQPKASVVVLASGRIMEYACNIGALWSRHLSCERWG